MTIKLMQQYIYERDTWFRLLDYLEEENILYKYRIAAILKQDDSDNVLVETIESFLNKFVMEDIIISMLRHDITKANTKIAAKGKDARKEGNTADIIITQDKLRVEIEIVEQQFNRLKFEFNKYLSRAS